MTMPVYVDERSAASARSLAAKQANETRQAKRDAAFLQSKFSGEKREVWTEFVIPFLKAHTPEGGLCADLLGSGHSAREMVAAGIAPLCCDDLSYDPEGWGKDRRRRAAEAIAADIGVVFVQAPFRDIVSRVETALYDPCGTMAVGSPAARDVQAAHEAGVRAMAVTILLARVVGGKHYFDGDPENYIAMAETVIRKVAPRYRIRRAVRYIGEGTPMAVLLLCAGAVGDGGRSTGNPNWCRVCTIARRRELGREWKARHPEFRERKNAKARERYRTDPEYRQKVAEETQRRRQDPEKRQHLLELERVRRASWTPERRERNKDYWAAYRLRHSAAIKERQRERELADPGVRQRRLDQKRAYNARPEVKQRRLAYRERENELQRARRAAKP